jgi:hypothetical protein
MKIKYNNFLIIINSSGNYIINSTTVVNSHNLISIDKNRLLHKTDDCFIENYFVYFNCNGKDFHCLSYSEWSKNFMFFSWGPGIAIEKKYENLSNLIVSKLNEHYQCLMA